MGKAFGEIGRRLQQLANGDDTEAESLESTLTMTPEQQRRLDDASSVTWGQHQSFSQDDFRLMLDAVAAAQIAGTLGQKQEQPLRDLYVKVAGLLKGAQDGALNKTWPVKGSRPPVEPLPTTTVRKSS